MDISFEKENLSRVVENIDSRLEDFKELALTLVSYEPDYSIQSIKYIELLGKALIDKIKTDSDLQKDIALYVGETIRRNYNGTWDICESTNDAINGQPCIKNISMGNKFFFPFLSFEKFMQVPATGHFLREIEEKDYLKPNS